MSKNVQVSVTSYMNGPLTQMLRRDRKVKRILKLVTTAWVQWMPPVSGIIIIKVPDQNNFTFLEIVSLWIVLVCDERLAF